MHDEPGCVSEFSNIKSFSSTQEILKSPKELHRAVIQVSIESMVTAKLNFPRVKRKGILQQSVEAFDDSSFPFALRPLVSTLLRRNLDYTESDLVKVLENLCQLKSIPPYYFPFRGVLLKTSVVKLLESSSGDALRNSLQRVVEILNRSQNTITQRLADEISVKIGSQGSLPLKDGEAWSDRAKESLASQPLARREAWRNLLVHCNGASGSTPNQKWLKTSAELLSACRRDTFLKCVLDWFPLVDKPRTQVIAEWSQYAPNPNLMIEDSHSVILKGLVWCCADLDHPELPRALANLALSSYKKVPGIGPRATKVGNACVYALGAMSDINAVGQLAFLKARVKFGTARKEIEKAFDRAAQRSGLPREEIEEMAVPAYGMDEVGLRREQLGDYTADLRVNGSTADLTVLKSDGKPLKSVPATVRKDHSEDLKELKTAVKDIDRMLVAQRDRIDQLFLLQKSWEYSKWRERYLDHPLVGTIARRLIWSVAKGKSFNDVAFLDGRLVDRTNKPIGDLKSDCTVTLWHPIGRPIDEIVAWRELLEKHEVRQPFKQAHREIYLLTDAERSTGTYSNRFAAHILRQHQFNALCGARSWKNKLRLLVDDTYPPATKALAAWGLRAEFWIEGIGDDFGQDTNDAGVYHRISTDQVRFYPLAAAQRTAHAGGGGYHVDIRGTADTPLALTEVPPLVFSEIMRDVDLFVGVASVGNDPTWADGGPAGHFRQYWQEFSFGELSNTAQTRKQVLERLIPRLGIAAQCSFEDRFLQVRGALRTYKIHLGSANILMSPNDQYLCIVPGQKDATTGGKLFLPFEGDRTLSIILSKALLLADDAKIKDPTITRQIKSN